MDWITAAVLGAVQGVTEFLPVSSSGHLLLIPWALGWDTPLINGLTFTVAVHVGTGVAAFTAMASQWRELLAQALQPQRAGNGRARLAAIIIGTLIVGLVAIFAEDAVATTFRKPWIAAVSLILGGVLLYASDRRAGPNDNSNKAGFYSWLAVATSQIIALIPGVSRSGITMTVARQLGIARIPAVVFSFQLMGPIILGAALWTGKDLIQTNPTSTDLGILVTATIVSAITGAAAARLLLRFLTRSGLGIFALYRVVIGLAMVGLLLTRI